MKALVVIPAYNEAMNICRVVEDIQNHTHYDYLIVNDCSRDNTLEICKAMHFHYLSLPVNYGLASAVQIGFKYALSHGYDAVVQFDGDGQHQAKYLPALFQEIENGEDIVIGSRYVANKKPFSPRMMGSRLLSAVIKLTTGCTIHDPTSGMRAFGKSVAEEYAQNMNYPPEPDTLVYMMKKGKRVKEVPVHMEERKFGKSYLSPINSMKYMVKMLISILFIQTFRKR